MLTLLDMLVEFTELQEHNLELACVSGATFKKDLFPWTKGDEVDLLQLRTVGDEVILEEILIENRKRRVVRSLKVELTARS